MAGCIGKIQSVSTFGDSCHIHCQHALCIFRGVLGLKPIAKRYLIIIGVCRACPCEFIATPDIW